MPARTELISRIAKRNLPTQGGAGPAESVGSWISFMVEDTSDIHVDDLAAAVAEGLRRWEWRPTAGHIHTLAEPYRDSRIADARINMQRAEIASRGPEPKALPAPPPKQSDIEALRRLGFEWDAKGNAVRIKAPDRDRKRDAPFAMPTQADLQAIADELDRSPVRARVELTNADYSTLGMAQPSRAQG